MECPICQKESATRLARGVDFEYGSLPGPFDMWTCDACGHGFLDPLPPPDALPTIYPPTYYTMNPHSPIHFDGFIYRTKMRRDVSRIVSFAKGRTVRSVADLGCGDGERLLQLGEALGPGVECVGVDFQPDPERAAFLRERGVRMVVADIEGGLGELEDGSLDLVILCQMIEHLRDPARALRDVARTLSPGGLLLLETPNLGGLDFRLFGDEHWGGYHFPRHFHVFTVETLRDCVARAGLDEVSRGFLPSGFGIVSLRNRLGLSSIERGPSFGEFLNMRNLFVVAAFTAFDLLCIALGGATSNQFLLARKPS